MLALAGAAVLAMLLAPPLDALAGRSFAWHMLQHLGLTMGVAPLLTLSNFGRVLLRLLPDGARRRSVRALRAKPIALATGPLVAWTVFAAVLYAAHFSPLYEAALEHEPMHAIEHALFLGAALLFWQPLAGGSARELGYPARVLYAFLALPQGAFVGLALYAADVPLVPHYVEVEGIAGALADQRAAGEIMWLGSGMVMLVALLCVVAAWSRHERRIEILFDRIRQG